MLFNKRKSLLVITFLFVIIFSSKMLTFSVETTEEVYGKLKLFTEIFTLVKNNYVETVDIQELVYGAAKGMVKSLDPFSQFLPPDDYKEMQVHTKGSFGGLGIRISIKEDWIIIITPLPGTPAYRAGILPQDKIIKIEGQTTKGFTVDDAVKQLRGKPGTKVTITISREGEEKPIDFIITREMIKIESITERIFLDNIAYIRISEFNAKTEGDFNKAMNKVVNDDTTGLILDLRNNPGGLLTSAVDVCKHFIGEEKLIVYTQGRDENKKIEYKSGELAIHPYLPLVVLVNKGSASGSEIVAGAIKDWNRGVILGTQTFGKGSVQTVMPLTDGSALKLTTAKYYTPNGDCIHDLGIEPDVIVPVSKEQLTKIMLHEDKIYSKFDKKESKDEEKKEEEEEEEGEVIEDPQLNQACSILKASKLFTEAEKR